MKQANVFHRFYSYAAGLVGVIAVLAVSAVGPVSAQQQTSQLKEPVYRISKARVDENVNPNRHPLDPAIELAQNGLKTLQANVRDYTCILVKRERIGDTLGDYEYIFAKIRNERKVNGQVVVPFSVYLYFLKPEAIRGREVIYVKGRNDDKMIAHEGRGSVWSRFGSVWLNPTGPIAMKGNRYPITEIGLQVLVTRLLEKGVRDRQRGECLVEFRKGAKINNRLCTMLQVTHPNPRPYFDFHIAQIFIDDELNVPVRYAAYTWPTKPGGKPVLQEEYTYLKLKLNVGLTDKDFDPKNPEYNF